MKKLAAIILALIICLPLLTGCGGGGGGGPITSTYQMASTPFTRSGITEQDQCTDMLHNLANSNTTYIQFAPQGYPDATTAVQDVTDTATSLANDPYLGIVPIRGMSKKTSRHAFVNEVLSLLFMTRSKSRNAAAQNTTYDGWNWTYTFTSGQNFSFIGSANKTGKGTIEVSITKTASASSSDPTGNVTYSLTYSLYNDSGTLYTGSENGTMSIRNGAITFNSNIGGKLNGVMARYGTLNGSGSYTYVDPDVNISLTVNGKESVISSDGYWVNVVFNDISVDTTYDTATQAIVLAIPGNGTFTVTASDGFNTSLTETSGSWAGNIKNAPGAIVATITGTSNATSGSWTVDFSGNQTTINF